MSHLVNISDSCATFPCLVGTTFLFQHSGQFQTFVKCLLCEPTSEPESPTHSSLVPRLSPRTMTKCCCVGGEHRNKARHDTAISLPSRTLCPSLSAGINCNNNSLHKIPVYRVVWVCDEPQTIIVQTAHKVLSI